MNLVNLPRIKRHWINGLVIVLASCASTEKEAILPQTGPTMKEVYERHFQGGEGSATQVLQQANAAPMGRVRRLGDELTDLKGYTRESFNETQLIFKRLPNPDLVMYVFPHLAGHEGSPVPGYSTAFPLYENVQYALPGEVED